MRIALLVAGLLASGTALAGDFLNLRFDLPDLSGPLTTTYPGGPLEGNTAQILQGWSIQYGGEPLNSIYYAPLGLQVVSPVTLFENSTANQQSPLGRYSLIIDGTRYILGTPPIPIPTETRISQRGSIPADAAGLWIFAAGTFQMSVNGERIDDPRLGTYADPVIDVSRWAGQTVDLEFRLEPGNSGRLDVLGFTSVPEPSTWALLGLGAATLLWQCRGSRVWGR